MIESLMLTITGVRTLVVLFQARLVVGGIAVHQQKGKKDMRLNLQTCFSVIGRYENFYHVI